jgi:hypothetical protein
MSRGFRDVGLLTLECALSQRFHVFPHPLYNPRKPAADVFLRRNGVYIEVRAAGVTNCTTEEELRRIIRDAGFKPVQRDTLYRTYFLN